MSSVAILHRIQSVTRFFFSLFSTKTYFFLFLHLRYAVGTQQIHIHPWRNYLTAYYSYDRKLYMYITKTCLYNSDPLKPHFYIVKLGFTVNRLVSVMAIEREPYFQIAFDKTLYFFNKNGWIFFLFLHENVCYRYSFEAPRRGKCFY